MKVGEARSIYGNQLRSYNEQKLKLTKQKEALQEKMNATPGGKEQYAKEAAILDLTYDAVTEKQEEYQTFMNRVMEQFTAKMQMVSAKQQGEALEEGIDEQGKLMEIARRLMHGDIVPAKDERKLMEYDSDLYQMAKQAGMMAKLRERKKYDSLWDEEEKTQQEDAMEAADGQEVAGKEPEVVSVKDTMESATAGDVVVSVEI